jgi:hypothetical protein
MAAVAKVSFYVIKDVPDGKLGDVPIKDGPDGSKVVLMSAEQARYWLDQGVLSSSHPEQVEERRKARVSAAQSTKAQPKPPAAPAKETEDPAERFSGNRKRERA